MKTHLAILLVIILTSLSFSPVIAEKSGIGTVTVVLPSDELDTPINPPDVEHNPDGYALGQVFNSVITLTPAIVLIVAITAIIKWIPNRPTF